MIEKKHTHTHLIKRNKTSFSVFISSCGVLTHIPEIIDLKNSKNILALRKNIKGFPNVFIFTLFHNSCLFKDCIVLVRNTRQEC